MIYRLYMKRDLFLYPIADIWSFGLSLMAVALGKYPLPTADGFFGLVDSVGFLVTFSVFCGFENLP